MPHLGKLAAVVLMAALGSTAGTVPESAAAATGPKWTACEKDATAQCATLSVPVDWADPAGPKFHLALARRTATEPGARIGSLVFGPGGPGDSGVYRVVDGISRFSDELRRRFDIVSFDPRGVGRSNPVLCSAELVAQQPSPVLTSQADFDAAVAYNRRLREDCRAHTGPMFDHVDTISMVKDLDAIRAALGERKLTFHGSSYGTLLGEQYAEAYPHRIRAMVLESVVDHSLGLWRFLDTQAAAVQDSFDEFVAWCDRATACALHGRDVRAIWADLVARAERGELGELTPFVLMVKTQQRFYVPDWAKLAQDLAALQASAPTAGGSAAPDASAPAVPNPFAAILCQDWSLPVRDYQEYARHLRRVAKIAPDMRYPRALVAPSSCLGWPAPANPQHKLHVRNSPTILLANSMHDPADGYEWATNVARQLGRHATLLTYEGWGHGVYNSSPCGKEIIDDYLISLKVPAPGTSCPAVE